LCGSGHDEAKNQSDGSVTDSAPQVEAPQSRDDKLKTLLLSFFNHATDLLTEPEKLREKPAGFAPISGQRSTSGGFMGESASEIPGV
jgi:hypothetical protein